MKYSLVTGGSRGLGRAICIRLSQMGIPVLINYQSNQQAAEEVRDSILAQGGQASLIKFNVADEAEVTAALEGWEKEHPDDYIAYLVNNAGIRKDKNYRPLMQTRREIYFLMLFFRIGVVYYVHYGLLKNKVKVEYHIGSKRKRFPYLIYKLGKSADLGNIVVQYDCFFHISTCIF